MHVLEHVERTLGEEGRELLRPHLRQAPRDRRKLTPQVGAIERVAVREGQPVAGDHAQQTRGCLRAPLRRQGLERWTDRAVVALEVPPLLGSHQVQASQPPRVVLGDVRVEDRSGDVHVARSIGDGGADRAILGVGGEGVLTL